MTRRILTRRDAPDRHHVDAAARAGARDTTPPEDAPCDPAESSVQRDWPHPGGAVMSSRTAGTAR